MICYSYQDFFTGITHTTFVKFMLSVREWFNFHMQYIGMQYIGIVLSNGPFKMYDFGDGGF